MTRLGFKPLNDVSWLSVLVYSLTADLATWFPLNSITVGCWLHDCHLEMLALVSKASKTRTWWPLQPLICRTVVLPLQAELQHTCNRSIPSLLGACDGENCFKQSGPRSGGTRAPLASGSTGSEATWVATRKSGNCIRESWIVKYTISGPSCCRRRDLGCSARQSQTSNLKIAAAGRKSVEVHLPILHPSNI